PPPTPRPAAATSASAPPSVSAAASGLGSSYAAEYAFGRPGTGAAGAYVADLYQRHSRKVLGLCRMFLRDRAEAEDAMQQTFLSAYRSVLGGNEPREPGAWLSAIARNECWARARARMREPLAEPELEGAGPDALTQAIA